MADVVGGNAGYFFDPLGSVSFHHLGPVLKSLGAVGYKCLVLETLVQDDLGHAVQQSHVGAWVSPQPQIGIVAHVDAARVYDDELGASLHHGPPHPGGSYRVVGGGVAADDQQATRILVVGIGVAGGPAAQGGEHGFDRRRVAEAGTVVDVVALHQQTGELLLDVAVLVGCFGRAEGAKRATPVMGQPLGDQVQSLVPGRWPEFPAFFD